MRCARIRILTRYRMKSISWNMKTLRTSRVSCSCLFFRRHQLFYRVWSWSTARHWITPCQIISYVPSSPIYTPRKVFLQYASYEVEIFLFRACCRFSVDEWSKQQYALNRAPKSKFEAREFSRKTSSPVKKWIGTHNSNGAPSGLTPNSGFSRIKLIWCDIKLLMTGGGGPVNNTLPEAQNPFLRRDWNGFQRTINAHGDS